MSDEIRNNCAESAACTSDCDTCGGCETEAINPDSPTVTLTLDDDTEVTCAVLNIFEVEGKEYISLLPLDEKGESANGEVYLYRYMKNENGDPELDNIEDDDEYMAAADVFNNLMEQISFQENPLDGIVENNEN
ncbi:MAG: DUF1292 domain-containing protein [Lachnospiraceae bacterium]|nr:DUF1292 domain-containing protein [Lachnospiraceae bacterium]